MNDRSHRTLDHDGNIINPAFSKLLSLPQARICKSKLAVLLVFYNRLVRLWITSDDHCFEPVSASGRPGVWVSPFGLTNLEGAS